MSLDYDLTEIKDRSVHFPPNTESVAILGTLNIKVNAAIWACLTTQIGTITADNADDWYTRYVLWNRLQGFESNPYPLTREDIHHLVGLRTNVYPDLPIGEWLTRLYERFDQDLAYSEQQAVVRAKS
jgi:hypothetical protein